MSSNQTSALTLSIASTSTSMSMSSISTSSSSTSSSVMMISVSDRYWVDHRGHSGIYTGSYDPQVCQPHGQGCMVYGNEISYKGQWVAGDWSGYGTLRIGKAQKYEGGFLDNQKHGLGVMTYCLEDGSKKTLDATFSFDSIMGKCRISYPDGSMYWGYLALSYDSQDGDEHVPHGRGKWSFPDGTVYDGEFDQGCMQGHGRITYPDGRWYLGEWTDGEKHGMGLEVMADGSVFHKGTFDNGRPLVCSSFSTTTTKQDLCLLYCTQSMTESRCRRALLVGPIPSYVAVNPIPQYQSWVQ